MRMKGWGWSMDADKNGAGVLAWLLGSETPGHWWSFQLLYKGASKSKSVLQVRDTAYSTHLFANNMNYIIVHNT